MGKVPTAVTVVTAPGSDGPLGATANAVVSLSVDPPLMLVALARASRTLVGLQDAARFGVNVLASDQGELAARFATKDPHPVKWDGVLWHELDGVPAIEGAVLAMACELREELDGGDHVILVGAVSASEQTDAEALVFHGGVYRPLG
ncbi:MAG: 3-hydroxy-9,10-secoandrosta,3,5(10)-triene-9,17-dione monooxygenase reductase component [Solirubrobacterales bacterium]|jgi:3-hydroxy-9,10-secoandrosta-1,3,5(10)-triene-9,17-dione monooxygenase reductase component|nr:3-hydroxy-9,10-secoandrosta,3,5(10)-triene-9,17-dione monooxygenase reductase component [Solirubrobacterales bacterium]